MTQTANQRVVREYVQRGHIQQAANAIPTTRNKLKVAAYARVSTDEAEQLNSYKTQCDYYTSYIQGKSEWEFVGLYADEYTSYGQNPKRPWIPTISVFTGVFIIQSLLTLPT